MANITNATTKSKVFKPISIGSNRDRRTSIIITSLFRVHWRLISYGFALIIALSYFFSIALEKGGY